MWTEIKGTGQTIRAPPIALILKEKNLLGRAWIVNYKLKPGGAAEIIIISCA